MSVDTVFYLFGSTAEAAVVGLLIYRRLWRTFPLFFAYNCWTLLASAGLFFVLRRFSPSSSAYVSAYFADMLVDSLLMLGVLIELAWSALRPLWPSLSRFTPVLLGVIILLLGAAIWPFATIPGASHLPLELAVLLRSKQTFDGLRVLIFLALAAGSQLLSLSWRDRELQIATGLGITSLVGLAVAMLHTYSPTYTSMRAHYLLLEQFVVVSYFCSLVYWVVSFAQAEEARRELSPQMQSMLLAVAGAARTTRVALAGSRSERTGKDR